MDEKQQSWSEDSPITGAAFARVDTNISCLLTRFHLRSSWSLLPFYLAFRRVRKEARKVSGLLQAVFLIENRRTCYTLSLWKDDYSIVHFGSVRSHIQAANYVFASGSCNGRRGPEIWSAQFRMWAVSCHNLNWEGLDLKTHLAEQWKRREMASGIAAGESR
ncbi:MAG: hypothetical protein C5B54_10365 [Acidobacteria bacterium]|nr:MAG: hypothetical protein C5B54_10365 [Acidobacteriota bacterium]